MAPHIVMRDVFCIPVPLGAGCKTRLEARINKSNPHLIYATSNAKTSVLPQPPFNDILMYATTVNSFYLRQPATLPFAAGTVFERYNSSNAVWLVPPGQRQDLVSKHHRRRVEHTLWHRSFLSKGATIWIWEVFCYRIPAPIGAGGPNQNTSRINYSVFPAQISFVINVWLLHEGAPALEATTLTIIIILILKIVITH